MSRPTPSASALRIIVAPAPPRALVALRPLGSAGRWRRLRQVGRRRGEWAARLPPGRYLIRLSAPGHLPEHRAVELWAPVARVVFHPVAEGARRCRFAGRRVPCRAPDGAVTAFLAPDIDPRRLVETMRRAVELGFAIDTRRVVDPGFRAVFEVFPPDTFRPRRPDGEPVEDPPAEAPADFEPLPIRPLPVRPREPLGPPPGEAPPERRPGDRRAAFDRLRRAQLSERRSIALPLRAPASAPAAAIAALRRLPDVTAAGAELRERADRPAVRRPLLDVRLLPGVTPRAVYARLAPVARRLLGRDPRWVSAGEAGARHAIADLYRLATPDPLDAQLEDIADALLATGLVLYAEPRIAERPVLLGDDMLAARQWALRHIGIDSAHAALGGRLPGQDVTLGVVDEGVRVVDGEVWHDDLRARMSLYDAAGRHGGHDHALHGHGGSVAALAAAVDHPGVGPGTVGVAPHARIEAFAHDASDVTALDETFRVAAGLAGLRDARGADVVVFACSVQSVWLPAYVADPVEPTLLSGPIFDALREVALRGRGGRGAVTVVAAGNTGAALDVDNPLGTSLDVITCGAADVDAAGVDRPAAHSNHGAALDCVAPGYREARPATIAAAPRAEGKWPGRALATGELVGLAETNTPTVRFDSAAVVGSIPTGARVVVGSLDAPGTLWSVSAVTASGPYAALELAGAGVLAAEAGTPVHVCDLRVATLRSPGYDGWVDLSGPIPTDVEQVTLVDPAAWWYTADFAVRDRGVRPVYGGGSVDTARLAPGDETFYWPWGTEVWVSAAGHHLGFGQTSGASAICAGVAALVLGANPALTAAEVRHLLCETAAATTGGADRVGAGRIDAAAAVTAALAYDHPRDLYFETGDAASGGRAPECLDVWVGRAPLDAAERAAAAGEPADSVHDRHQTLDPHQPAWICARVRNRARTDGAPALAAWVRVYVTPAPSGDAPLRWPEHFTAHPAITPLSAESHLVGEAWVPPGLDPGAAHVVQIEWPAWATPAGPDDWQRHLAVEICPHDGPATGATIATNDNLARRAISFESTPS